MFRTRRPRFALVCIGVWLLQFGLIAVAFGWIGAVPALLQWWWELAALGATVGLGGMLLAQLPRAMQWRPRLSKRPSAEVIAERRRIARDLHDHLGAQLVCALVLLEGMKTQERGVHAVLEKCLLDLRLIVDTMDGTDAPFADRLAQLRYRMEPVLAQRGIRMSWDVQASDGVEFPQPDSSTHLVAIVQEALSNALQHAKASEIWVSVRNVDEPTALCLEVGDNGVGIGPRDGPLGNATTGSGIAGMARRARMAGGELSVAQGPTGGTCIRVVVPVTAQSGVQSEVDAGSE